MLEITLSRRNLLSMLHKLEMTGSGRAIIKPAGDTDEVMIHVATDEEVYADRLPGPMHPETEKFVARMNIVLDILQHEEA